MRPVIGVPTPGAGTPLLKKLATLGACAALAFTGVAVPVVVVSSADSTGSLATYGSCTELNRDYRHGISDRHMTKRQWIRKGASGEGAYKPNLYDQVHSNLDRDDDHIACEH